MADRSSTQSLAVWAGIECTVNRVGDRYHDQLVWNGHAEREADLDLVKQLGVSAVRYPVLWERVAPTTLADADWTWTDRRLARLQELGVEPIAGLVHHGSGPAHTSLVDERFPELLAAYARAVATRYPWLRKFTPVNEPLTTARFSGLYGHWYPHGKDYPTCIRALLVQCRAIVAAMRAIREVIPDAQLVTTEDLGSVQGSPELQYQIDFENRRRWLSMDLLTGRIDRHHPLREFLERNGATAAELDAFVAAPCPPDVMGFNYYLTSERWLDIEVERWPAWSHGGNERDRYADVHSVLAGKMLGAGALVGMAWDRYQSPLALTEVHLGGTREEQLRWLVESYDSLVSLRACGADIVALTAWSMFGAFDWNTLVTQAIGFYEPGLYDIRGPVPRPTALARAVQALARGTRPTHPVLSGPGFWRRATEVA